MVAFIPVPKYLADGYRRELLGDGLPLVPCGWVLIQEDLEDLARHHPHNRGVKDTFVLCEVEDDLGRQERTGRRGRV